MLRCFAATARKLKRCETSCRWDFLRQKICGCPLGRPNSEAARKHPLRDSTAQRMECAAAIPEATIVAELLAELADARLEAA